MHISEGVLSGPVLLTGGVLTVAGTAIGLKKLDFERIARAGILSSAFFVASLIHVPVGPSSVHLILNGIVGLILGWGAFPAILVALFLQGMLFQFGGLTTLGVNTLIMALPAVVCYYSFGPLVQRDNRIAMPAGCTNCLRMLRGILIVLGFLVGMAAVWVLRGSMIRPCREFEKAERCPYQKHARCRGHSCIFRPTGCNCTGNRRNNRIFKKFQ